MQTVIFIPARYPSQRFPGKPLAMLTGASGVARSLIRRSWDAAQAVPGVTSVYVLTDDDRIAAHAREFGADVLMTSDAPRNGTERCAEALDMLEETPETIVNLQGDAPLTPPHYVTALIDAMRKDAHIEMATPVLRTEPHHLAQLQNDRKEGRVGATTAVFDQSGDALYFSKEVLPFADRASETGIPVFHHVGCYAYRPKALGAYPNWPMGPLEQAEGLEQLRFLENRVPVRCVEVQAKGRAFWELNNPHDIPIIEGIMKQEGIA